MKIVGEKLKMTQIFKGDRAYGVTPIRLEASEALAEVKEGDLVKVGAISKAKGFQGVVKRHGFSGGPKTHGQKNRLRAPGSIGNTAPQRTLPGRRMAGRMGGVKITVKNLKIISIDSDKNILMLNGAVPGNTGTQVLIRK